MAKYSWQGKNRSGKVQKGEMEAPNEAMVRAQLRRQGIAADKVKESGKGMFQEDNKSGSNSLSV